MRYFDGARAAVYHDEGGSSVSFSIQSTSIGRRQEQTIEVVRLRRAFFELKRAGPGRVARALARSRDDDFLKL
jgi:hypothetical protein